MSSSIGPAGLALATLIETAAATSGGALYGVQVTFGPPDQYEEQEVIALLGVSGLDELARVLGAQVAKRDENYGLDIAVKCYKPEQDRKDVWTRGWEMYSAVREIVLANLTLGDTVAWCGPTGRDSTGVVRPVGEDGKVLPGWVIRNDMTVICKARA